MASQAEIDLIVNATNTLAELQRDIRRIVDVAERTAPTIDLQVDVDRDGALKKFTSEALPKLGSLAGGIAKIGLTAAPAISSVASLAAAVANIAPAAAVATQGLLAMQLVTGTLKLGFNGVEDAITAAFDPETKPEDLQKALDKLSPSARKFVKELRSMKTGFKDLQLDVQDRLFKNLAGGLQPLADAVLPSVSKALGNTADSLNHMAIGAAQAAIELGRNGTLDKALQGATTGIENLADVPGRVVTGFGQLAAASAPAFDRLTAAADRASAKIADKLTDAFESGQLERAIDNAIDLIKQLGNVAGNILGGLGSIFTGLTGNGRDLFSILEEISGTFQEIASDPAFQEFLHQLVLTADSLVRNVLPLFKQAILELAPALSELGPPLRDFFDQIGPKLTPVLEELGPILLDLATILRDQMPTVIAIVGGALESLTVILKGVHLVLTTFVIPALRLVADVFTSEFVTAIADGSRDFADRIGVALGKFNEFRDGIAAAVGAITGNFAHFVGVIMPRFVGGVREGVDRVIGFFRDLPGLITSAIGDLGGLLFNAGANLISGFIDGIESKIAAVASVLLDLTSKLPDWKGPADVDKTILFESGKFVMQGFQEGIASQLGSLRGQLGGVTAALPGVTAAGVQSASATATLNPTIIVRIGNEDFRGFVDTRVNTINSRNTRIAAQGVRR